jgi:RNA polymerase sigma factor (sigma-70 family)
VEPTSISLAAASDFVLRLAYRLCGPEGADDVHQETFRRLCQSGKVNHGMVECNLSQLSRITRNAFLDILKVGNTKKRGGDRVTISLDAEDIELPSAGATPESLVVQAAQVRDLRRAIHHLRPDQQIIVKCLLEGKSIADIAREMEIPASTINSRLRAAEAVLRVALYGTAAGERYE